MLAIGEEVFLGSPSCTRLEPQPAEYKLGDPRGGCNDGHTLGWNPRNAIVERIMAKPPMTDPKAEAIARKAWCDKDGMPIPIPTTRVAVARKGNAVIVSFLPENPDSLPSHRGDFIAQVVIDGSSGAATAFRVSP